MHDSSYKQMILFVNNYLDRNKELKILDVGSHSVLGQISYKDIITTTPAWHYFGLDLVEGTNVDIITKDLYNWPIKDNTYDVIISGQCLEHVEDMYKWIKEVSRVLKPDGLVCIIAPNSWGIHKHPIDCWRIFPDGMKFLMTKIGGLKELSIYMNGVDTIGIGTK